MRIKQREGLKATTAWVRKRERDSKPPEQLSSDRESRFAEEEQRAADRGTKDDSSYKTSSSEAELD